MLFITNRALKQSHRTRLNRRVKFDLDDNGALQSLFYCRRNGVDDYTEIGGKAFREELRDSPAKQILIFIHGFSNLPEPDIFPRAKVLQEMFDKYREDMVQVVPLVWPCDNDAGVIKDYFDDQLSADASGYAYARVLEGLRKWQSRNAAENQACLKRVNVLAHSMGNRVFRETMRIWVGEHLRDDPPLVFRNAFLVAADIVNESLQRGNEGELICAASRNVVVYFASDDLALRASKAANIRNKIASRRLGHTGPEDMSKVARNIHALDCDEINTRYDTPTGHTYFLQDEQGNPGKVFKNICQCIETGRVPSGENGDERLSIL